MSSWPQVLTTPAMQLSLMPLLGMALFQCLVAIWAATSRGHWFIRAVGVWMAIALLVPIGAWEAAWLFALSSLLVVLLLNLIRWLRRRPALEIASSAMAATAKPLHFGIRDLFLLLLIVGMWLPLLMEIVRNELPDNMVGWLVAAISLAVIAVLCQLVVNGPGRPWAAVLFFCAVPGAAAATWASGDWMGLWDFVGVHPLRMFEGAISLMIVALEFALFLIATLLLNPMRQPREQSVGRRIVSAGAFAVTLLVPAIPTAMLYWALLEHVPQATRYVMPTVNHYPRIVAIATQLQRLNPRELSIADLKAVAPTSTTPQEVEALYAELLPLLEVPNASDYDPDRDAIMAYSPPFQLCRSLARAMRAEGESMRSAGQADRAADYAQATIRLGRMWCRGGIAIQTQVGLAIEGVGYQQLASYRAELSPERSRAAIASLQRSLAEREDFASLYAREMEYQQRAYGWQDRLEDQSERLFRSARHWSTSMQDALAREGATNLLLQTDLAIRVFKHDHNRWPHDLGELVPAYLPQIPLDPHSQLPLKYQPAQPQFVLYSVGFDGHDDGGRFGSVTAYGNACHRREPGLDFDLDTLWP
jgi:hypothetical protein